MDYSIKKFSKSDIPQITNLLITCFHFRTKDKEAAMKWKYDYRQFPRKLFFYGMWNKKGKLVSQYANLENNILYGGKIVRSLICFDMATHPNYRGRGFISQLSQKVYSEVSKSSFSVSFGYSNDQGVKVDKYATGYGYSIVGKFTKYIKTVLFPKSSLLVFRETQSISEKHTPPTDNYFRIYKPPKYLTWRYIDRPGNQYKIYEVTTPTGDVGFVVIRLHDLRVDLMDIIGFPNHFAEVLKGVECLTKKLRRAIIVVNVLENSHWKKLLKDAGFIHQSDKTHIYLTVKIHQQNGVLRGEILDQEKWLLMGGDIW